MTQPKSYNRKIFCELIDVEEDSEEANDFMNYNFKDQLLIIKQIREENANITSVTLLDRILLKK